MPSSLYANPVFQVVTSGTATVPTSALEWSIQAISGGFWVNGTGPFDAPAEFSSAIGPLSPLVIGCSGGKTAVYYGGRPVPGGG